MKVTKTQLKKIIKEELEEAAMDEGFMDSIKGAAGAVGAKAWDKVQGTGNVAQTVQVKKQITTMVQNLVKEDPRWAKSLAQHLQKLAAEIMPKQSGF
jgi:hypothetical protein